MKVIEFLKIRECKKIIFRPRKYLLAFSLMAIFSSLMDDYLFSQEIQSQPVRQQALEAFSRGDFEKAYNGFSELLKIYSKDPLYKYYSGVCLVQMKRDPLSAVTLLDDAIKGANIVRSVPADGLFWLGRAHQLAGNYNEAISSFNKYSEAAGKRKARELDVHRYVKECNERRGAIHDSDIKKIDETIKQEKPLPEKYDRILSEALVLQNKADSANRIADGMKKASDSTGKTGNEEVRKKIIDAETIAASFQKKADEKYTEAHAVADGMSVQVTPVTQKDTIAEIRQKVSIENKPLSIASEGVLSSFRVVEKPVYDLNEKIQINPAVPQGLIYRIQVAVFRNEVAPSYFKGITPVYGFRTDGTDRTNYYAGMFRRKTDASKALLQVRQKGFRDAFIVAFSGNKIISADRAAVLEKEWGRKPFPDDSHGTGEMAADTVPPTLSFRVEITRSEKPLGDDAEANIRKLATGKGLDIWLLSDGSVVYLIGKFITFESAEEYASLLARNGYRDAKVGAWLGKKEIPVETARQLFEKLE
jgi:tetratricopeptide (TPR) repeat protein